MTTRSRLRVLLAALALPALLASPGAAQGPPRQPNAARQGDATDEDFARAMRLFQGGDHAQALPAFLVLARGGHAGAQCMVGLMHHKGYAVPRNPTEGARWYAMAALGGDRDALFMLGQLWYRGEGLPRDPEKAADLFLRNAVAGDRDGMWAFGVCLAGGEGRPRDPIEAGAWLLLASARGHDEAPHELERLALSAGDLDLARGAARQLEELLRSDGFDPAKLPRIPVPDGLSLDPNGPPAAAQGDEVVAPPVVEAGLDVRGEFTEVGDALGEASLTFPPDYFRALTEAVPDPRFFLRDLASSRADQELGPDAGAEYDPAQHGVRLRLNLLGAVRNLGAGRWQWEASNHRFDEVRPGDDGRLVATFDIEENMRDEGLVLRGRAEYLLPSGAADIAWDRERHRLSWSLPAVAYAGKGRLKVRFDVRDRIMSCLYKVYGLEDGFPGQWVGKAVFSNTGDGPLTDLKVRFQLGEYSQLDLWQKVPELLPGQTACVVYRPVLAGSIATLTSTTPANVVAEWRYVDTDGREREDSDGGRISILGRHEFVFSNLTEHESTGSYYDAFSNAEFVAAWVTRDDPVVKQFAAAANKAAGGAGAPYSDEAAWKVLKACYEIWLANDFTYQGPVGLTDPSLSFDNKIVQNMKFPRDVVRDRSGTCIELTALYCAMAHAIGLEPTMVLVPGHAFPVVQLPSGKYLPVECTGVAGGKRYGAAGFEQAVEAAGKTYEKWSSEGLVIEVDIEAAWSRGVSSPELEPVPADVLQRWGTVLEFTLSPDQGGGTTPVQPQQPERTNGADARPFLGRWSGTATQAVAVGPALRWTFDLNVTADPGGVLRADTSGETRVPNAWGGADLLRFEESFEGQVQGGGLALRGTRKILAVNGQSQPLPTDTMTLRMNGQRLSGEVRLPDGTTVQVEVGRTR